MPAIPSAERIHAFQRALAELTRPRKNPLRDCPLTGRIHGPCGRTYVGCFRSEDEVRTYRCSGWNAAAHCGCVFLRADHAEEQVARHVNVLLASMPLHSRPIPPASSQVHTQLIRHLERVRTLERLAAQLEVEQEVFGRILAHARDWQAELEDRVDGEARLVAALGAAAPDIRSLSAFEQRGLLESLKVRVDIVDPEFRYREGTRRLAMQWHERTGTPVPPDPTDSQWARVEELLRSQDGAHHFRSSLDLKPAFTGMPHRLRTGILWHDLPERFGNPEKVRCRQRTWLADGVWPDIVKLLDAEGKGTPVLSHEATPALAIRTGLDSEALC